MTNIDDILGKVCLFYISKPYQACINCNGRNYKCDMYIPKTSDNFRIKYIEQRINRLKEFKK